MIDTVCLLIPQAKAILIDLTGQGVTRWDLQSKTNDYQKFVRNPSRSEKDLGLYYPRLTAYRRRFGDDANFKVEFSAPKLIYKNNLEELSDGDFEKVIDALKDRLYRLGVVVENDTLVQAKVSSVHFSKNIVLSDGCTSSYIISEIGKIDLRKSFDFARARYINDGQSLCAHTTAHELAIYDKIADLAKDKKRAVDKDQTQYQMSLFHELEKRNKLLEVIRFEIRLAKKQKLNSVLAKLGYNKDPTFKDVFSSGMGMKVVRYYWEAIIKERNLGLFTIQMSQKDILRNIYRVYPTIKPNRALYLIGLFALAKEGNGMRELRSMLAKKTDDRTWYRLANDLRQLSSSLASNQVRDWVTQIDQALTDYKPLTHNDYEKSKK